MIAHAARALGLTLSLAGAALACTNIYGIPAECEVQTYLCTVPGVGAAAADAPPEVTRLTSLAMIGNWAYHAYELAPAGDANLVFREDAVEVHHAGRRVLVPRDPRQSPPEASWSPDGRRFACWRSAGPGLGRELAVVELAELSRGGLGRVVYNPATAGWPDRGETRIAFEFNWSPDGASLLVLERLFWEAPEKRSAAAIVRVGLDGGVEEVLRQEGGLDFAIFPGRHTPLVVPPAAAGGVALLGTPQRLSLLEADGAVRPLPFGAAAGVHNVEWSPAGRELLVFWRRGTYDAQGRSYRGLYRLSLAPGEDGELPPPELLDEATDIHTVWWSPRGTFASWSTEEALGYRVVDAAGAETVWIEAPRSEAGAPLELKGFSWHPSERWLAFAAGDRLYVHDVAAGASRQVAAFGRGPGARFVAQPSWVGDRVLLTLFHDLGE